MTDSDFYNNDIMWQWINSHINDDPARLRLSHNRKEPWTDFAIMQIDCRHRASRKLPVTLRNDRFLFPTMLSAEQCTSDSLATFHSTLIGRGDTVLDMTCGLGIDAFHMSPMASHVTSIDIDSDVASAAAHNAAVLCQSNITIVNADSTAWLAETDSRFDTIFIDPARRGEGGRRLWALADCSPDVTALLPIMREKGRRLIVKASPMLDVSHTLQELPSTTDLYAIGTTRECKELLAVVDLADDRQPTEPVIHAVTDNCDFSFTRSEEATATAEYATPRDGWMLYEPYPASMKAGAFKLMCDRFGLAMLNNNTHLYTGQSCVTSATFPGEEWHIDKVIPWASCEIKKVARTYKNLQVSVRNFGMTADQLRAKLKVTDGGDRRLIGVTGPDGKRMMLIVSRK